MPRLQLLPFLSYYEKTNRGKRDKITPLFEAPPAPPPSPPPPPHDPGSQVGVKSAKRQLDLGLKLNLNGKRLYPTDDHLAFKQHIVGISAKLNKANALVSKIRH